MNSYPLTNLNSEYISNMRYIFKYQMMEDRDNSESPSSQSGTDSSSHPIDRADSLDDVGLNLMDSDLELSQSERSTFSKNTSESPLLHAHSDSNLRHALSSPPSSTSSFSSSSKRSSFYTPRATEKTTVVIKPSRFQRFQAQLSKKLHSMLSNLHFLSDDASETIAEKEQDFYNLNTFQWNV